jgi:hypothetical protein
MNKPYSSDCKRQPGYLSACTAREVNQAFWKIVPIVTQNIVPAQEGLYRTHRLDQKDATNREHYLKTYNGKMYSAYL